MKRRRPPPNWIPVGFVGKNKIYQCPALNSDKTQRCIFTGRIDQVFQHIESKLHTFEVIKNQRSIHENEEDIKSNIENLAISFGGELQLSLNQISSDAFTAFVRGIIMLTGNYVLSHNNESFNAETFYQGMSRNTVKSKIINNSLKAASDKRKLFRQFSKYIAISIDAGSLQTHNLLEFMIANPSSGLKPALLYSTEFLSHSSDSFFNELQKAIEIAKNEKFTVTSVVADNVSYQKAVLAHWKPNSHINKSGDEMIKSLIYITCNSHNLDLVVTAMIKKNELFNKVTLCATLLADLSRRKTYSHYFAAAAPRIPSTRWLYLYEFTSWIIDHKDNINRFIENAPTIIRHYYDKINKYEVITKTSIEDFEKVYCLLKPLRKLSDSIESDHCCLFYVVPLVELCCKELIQLKQSPLFENDHTPTIILELFAARFRKTASSDVLCLAYSLTSEGRHALGMPPDLTEEDVATEMNSYFKLTLAPEVLQENLFRERVVSYDKIKYREAFQKYVQSSIEDMHNSSFQSFQNELERIQQSSESITEIFQDKYIQAKGALSKHLVRLGYDENKIKTIQRQFTQFIHRTNPSINKRIIDYLNQPPFLMWKSLHNANIFPELSDYAMRICSISASEAMVERLFSTIKHFLSTRQKSSNELIDAYVNILPDKYAVDCLQFYNDDDELQMEPSSSESDTEDGGLTMKTKKIKKPQQRSLMNYFETNANQE